MSQHTHPIFDDMDTTKDCSGRQPLEEFTLRFRCHLWATVNSQGNLRSLRGIFASGKRLWPLTCTNAIQSLSAFSEHSRNFHASIQRSKHLPLAVVPLRLDLLMTLRSIDLQITKLTQLLTTLHEVSKTALSQTTEERHTIVRELDVLILYSEQAVQHAEELLRKAQEREYSAV